MTSKIVLEEYYFKYKCLSSLIYLMYFNLYIMEFLLLFIELQTLIILFRITTTHIFDNIKIIKTNIFLFLLNLFINK